MSDVTPPPPASPYSAGAPASPSGAGKPLSITSMILGLVGLVCCSWFGLLGILIPIGAVVLGFIGRSKEPSGKGLAMTGIITGFIGIATSLLWLVLVTVLGFAFPVDPTTYLG